MTACGHEVAAGSAMTPVAEVGGEVDGGDDELAGGVGDEEAGGARA